MYLFDNPVLQRELLVNLRTPRAFVLLLVYQIVLAAVVYFAWPQASRLDLSERPPDAQTLANLFFLGQYVLASLMAPSFAAGAITGEKERKTYEMLLASPLRPSAIVLGKMVASLTHIAVLIFSSLPIIMLCLPLGGVHYSEVLAAYAGMICSVVAFGAIGVACSSYFQRTASSLVVSYLLILPLVLGGVLLWQAFSDAGSFRLLMTVAVLPALALALCVTLFFNTAARLLHPPDVGSEGKEVVDLEREAVEAVGLYIERDKFPDKLFAPAKREDLLEDGVNPIYDKEIRSEIFSQGTLMLRLVIQVSLLLALPLMAGCLFIFPSNAPLYIGYVLLFNVLVGPVFSAGSLTSERERQTLDLLLTTSISPWQIIWGKLIAGLRVSSVLTIFLLWPVLLASVMVNEYWSNLLVVAGYVAIVLITCVTSAMVALTCSALFRKTSVSLMWTYIILIGLFFFPLAARFFASTFFPDHDITPMIQASTFTSPFETALSLPLYIQGNDGELSAEDKNWQKFLAYVVFSAAFVGSLLVTSLWWFRSRWRVSE